MTSAPIAEGGQRPDWDALPLVVQDAIEELLGSSVVRSVTQRGGFSPASAARILLSDGRKAFVKAGSGHLLPGLPDVYRREIEVVPQLPLAVPVPRLLGSTEAAGWVIAAYEDIDGHNPHLPWRPDELTRVLAALTDLAEALTPAPFDAPLIEAHLAEDFSHWRDLQKHTTVAQLERTSPWSAAHLDRLQTSESRWAEASTGETLLHCDVRTDNLLMTADRVYIFDWNWACIGAAWVDLLCMLPSSAMHGGIDVEAIIASHPLTRDVEPWRIDAVLAALAGMFIVGSYAPPPPGIPRLRAFQLAQGIAAAAWLEQRWSGR